MDNIAVLFRDGVRKVVFETLVREAFVGFHIQQDVLHLGREVGIMAAHLVVRKLVDHSPKDAVASAQAIPILGNQRVDEATRERQPDRDTAILGVEGDADGLIPEAAITHDASDFVAQREECLTVEAHELVKALTELAAHEVRYRHLLASSLDDHIGVVVDHDRVSVDEVRTNRKVAGAGDASLQLIGRKFGHFLPVDQQLPVLANRDLVALCNAREGCVLHRDIRGQVDYRAKHTTGIEVLDVAEARSFPRPALVGVDGIDIIFDLTEIARGVVGKVLAVEVKRIPRLIRFHGRHNIDVEPVGYRVTPRV